MMCTMKSFPYGVPLTGVKQLVLAQGKRQMESRALQLARIRGAVHEECKVTVLKECSPST